MATSSLIRGDTFKTTRGIPNAEPGSISACRCGFECLDEEEFRQHERSHSQHPSIPCSFCNERFPSSIALRDHLLLCGNKTDPCPNCNQFIRRSHFTYHYENQCATLDDVETPPSRAKNAALRQHPPNSNRPVSREDIVSDHNQENNQGRPVSTTSHRKASQNAPLMLPIRNANANPGQQLTRIPLQSNHNAVRVPTRDRGPSNGTTQFPCEICNELIDIAHWSQHMQTCLERNKQRLSNTALSMSRQPVTEQLPCEYCQSLVPAQQLHTHEASCSMSPERHVVRPPTIPPRKGGNFALSTLPRVPGQLPSPNAQSNSRRGHAHYQTIDLDRTHAANRPSNADEPTNIRPTPGRSPRITANDESTQANAYRSQDIEPSTVVPDPPTLINSSANNRKARSKDPSNQPLIDSPSHAKKKKPKMGGLRRFFGCASRPEYDT